ncbi:ExbD/TolR family protein [Alkalinema pantanalense CENA528]|uniref:ExbD/TolR family protein n=1 Tax=Alkalinema pantanalense TaxID=1620705 RepID=UPI003D6DE8A1
MPRRRAIAEPEQPTQINIVPMIDVTFSILAFFIMSTLFLTRLETLSVNLPKAKNSQTQFNNNRVTLTINEQGNLFLNRQPIQADQVVDSIQKLQRSDQPLVVILNADRAINYGDAVEVLDKVRQVPGVKVALSTKKDAAPVESETP